MSRARIALGGVCLALAVAGAAFAQAAFKHSKQVHQAYETLRHAECFEAAHVGFAGSLSHYVEAFRVILTQERGDASEMFRSLSKEATTAGKLYAVSGLYFTDPGLFPEQLEQLRKASGGESVCTMSGCIRTSQAVDEVLRSPHERMRISRGQSVKEYFDAETKAGHDKFYGDIAGGYKPLSLLEGDPKAPRDPL